MDQVGLHKPRQLSRRQGQEETQHSADCHRQCWVPEGTCSQQRNSESEWSLHMEEVQSGIEYQKQSRIIWRFCEGPFRWSAQVQPDYKRNPCRKWPTHCIEIRIQYVGCPCRGRDISAEGTEQLSTEYVLVFMLSLLPDFVCVLTREYKCDQMHKCVPKNTCAYMQFYIYMNTYLLIPLMLAFLILI